jgi:hypothetical protein
MMYISRLGCYIRNFMGNLRFSQCVLLGCDGLWLVDQYQRLKAAISFETSVPIYHITQCIISVTCNLK